MTMDLMKFHNLHLKLFFFINVKVKLSLCLTMHHAMKTMGEWWYRAKHS